MTNTPWGERHAYVLARGDGRVLDGGSTRRFHVSPFMGMDQRYEWRVVGAGRARCSVHIESSATARRAFDATLTLAPARADRRALRRVLVRYPAATLPRVARIYAHALRLKLKGAPYFPHPEAPVIAPRARRSQLLRRVERRHARASSTATARTCFGAPGAPLRGTVTVHDPRVWRALLRGSRGARRGLPRRAGGTATTWSPRADRGAQRRRLDRLRRRFAAARAPVQRAPLAAQHAERAAAATSPRHYDLGNDLFEVLLDATMTYSCALFERAGHDARPRRSGEARARSARSSSSRPDDHLLEIGTGWGGARDPRRARTTAAA